MVASLHDAADAGARRWLDIPASAFLRRVEGRETFRSEDAGLPVVVKRTRGTVATDAWYELLRGRARRSPARREFENLAALAADGFPVPRAITFCEDLESPMSAVVMEWVDHELTLLDLARQGRAPERLAELARLVARLHARGWYHRDLYLQHVIVRRSDDALVLLDVGRARRERSPRERWFVKDLAALHHSAPASVLPRERLRFFARYCATRGIRGRAERRRWIARVEAKARRMAAHVPVSERGAR